MLVEVPALASDLGPALHPSNPSAPHRHMLSIQSFADSAERAIWIPWVDSKEKDHGDSGRDGYLFVTSYALLQVEFVLNVPSATNRFLLWQH